MSKKVDTTLNFRELQQQLELALSLIDKRFVAESETTLDDSKELRITKSLLSRCEQVVRQSNDSKPTLRLIHHFACSGGTLISKCIAAQPNVFLFSELHPTTRMSFNPNKGTYTPRDLITQAFYSRVPDVNILAEHLFVKSIISIEEHVRERGGVLVLRAHSHADYCTDVALPEMDSLTRLLTPFFDIKQLITVRNPIDSFLSLRLNGWVHFKPDSFEEYCSRLISFLAPFNNEHIVQYEDFVEHPEAELKNCLKILNLPEVEYSLDYIDIFKVSGDSGRSSVDIKPRERRQLSAEYLIEIKGSASFEFLKKKFKFKGVE